MKIKCVKNAIGLQSEKSYNGVVIGKYVLVTNDYDRLKEYSLDYFHLEKEMRKDKIEKILHKYED